MKPRLIATDLDGTFLGADGVPSASNVQAAYDAAAAGIEFVVATGRPRRWLHPLEPLRDLNPVVISSNGAAIGRLNDEHATQTQPLSPATILDIARSVDPKLRPAFAVEFDNVWGRQESYPPIHGDLATHIAPLEELVETAPIIKLLLRTEGANTEQLAEIVAAMGAPVESTFSWTESVGTVEMSAAGVTKGSALAAILDQRGLSAEQCAAFGDMPNDLEMLRLAGAPFVMANGHPTMLTHGFTEIGHHHDDAVGRQIRSWLS